MSMRLGKLYTFVFYRLRGSFKWMFDDGLEDWKALVLLCGTEVAAVMAIRSIIAVSIRRRLSPFPETLEILIWVVFCIGLVALNYRGLISERRWARFEAEFKEYSTTTRVLSGIAIAAGIISIAVLALVSAAAESRLPH